MKKSIAINKFIANGGDIQKIKPEHIILNNNLDISAIDLKTGRIIPVSVKIGEVGLIFNKRFNTYCHAQMYSVTYKKDGINTTQTVAGHLVFVKVEVVLAESFK
jgi:hypothetical protein